MSRRKPAEPAGLDPVRRLTRGTARRIYGRQLEPMGLLAHHRPLLVGVASVSLALERYSRSVDLHLKQLAMLRTSQLAGCEWCLDFGSYLAQRAGISEVQLHELSMRRPSTRFDQLERLVTECDGGMSRIHGHVHDESF